MSTAQLAPGTAIEGCTVHSVVRTRVGAITYDAVDAAGVARQLTVYEAECFPSALVLERSLRELRQLQTLQHPRIVKVHGCGKLASGATWELHDPLPPGSLADHLRNGAFPEPDALAIAQQIGEALADAQKIGVIHRNLGADVVFPSPDGVLVTGFAVGAPQGGRSFGALDSIAPEQVEGKVVDQRTLIYNLAALVHYMVRGTPLFTGDTASVLQAHLSTDVADTVVSPLRRGLAKDPRMRPMMLKQFVTELAGGLVGSATRPPASPTSRGWTMFTSAIDDSASASTTAPVPAPDAPVAPSTRGWTMFMQDGSTPAATPEPAAAPAPAAPAPAAAAPPTAPDPAAPVAPSTRGWTMFMQAQEDAAPAAAPATSQTVVAPPPATPTPAAAPAPAPAAPAAAAPKPSTRGWTMFTTADEPAATPSTVVAPAPSAPVAPPPVAASSAAPSVAAPPPIAAPPAVAADASAPKPSSRGWTMFTRDDEATAAASPSTVVAPPPAPPEPEPEAAGDPGQPPSSRGWTVFMEPSTAASVAAAAGAPPATASAPSVEATPAAGTEAEPAAAPGPRRGWTMFMEAPIDDAGRRPFGPSTPTPATTPADAAPPPAEEASSDNRGWTVFGAPSPAASAATVVEGEGAAVPPPPQQHGTDAHARGTHDASVAPVASGSMTANAEPEPAPGRAKTVVASGVQAVQGSVGGVTGRTVFPATGQPPPGEMPDTMYFRRGDIPPERPASRSTTAVDVAAPAGRPPAEERNLAPQGGAIVAPGREAPIAKEGGRRMVPIVAVGVVVVGLVVAAVIWLT